MYRWILAAMATIGAAAPVGLADSIWDRRDPRYSYLFEDNRARHIGDVVTIAIAENTVANESDVRALLKTTAATAGAQFGTSSSSAGAGTTVAPILNVTSSRQFNGNAAYTMSHVFTDQMNAV